MQPTEKSKRAETESRLRELFDAGDLAATANLALSAYGPEILGFISAIHRNPADASDVFSEFCEQLWKSLDRFAWRSTFRTWAYTIARRASLAHLEGPIRRVRSQVRLSQCPEVEDMAEQVRTQTLDYLRTEVKDRFLDLRERLSDDDRQLVILRVDRKLAFKEIALVMLPDEVAPAPLVTKEAARLRKRYESVKEKLRKLGREEGLLGEE